MNEAFELDPRLATDTHPVAHWPLCELRLMDDALYPWLVLVPRRAGVRELIDLDAGDRQQLSAEVDRAAQLLRTAFRPDKLNVAALGNVVAQLHVHVIARFGTDPAWPAPVWGKVEAQPYSPEALVTRVQQLQAILAR